MTEFFLLLIVVFYIIAGGVCVFAGINKLESEMEKEDGTPKKSNPQH